MVDSRLIRRRPRYASADPLFLLLLFAMLVAGAPESALGQEASDEDDVESSGAGQRAAPPSGVEVIRVKGRAVTQIETDVPDSVTQFDAATIEALGAQNVADLAAVTPNVEITTAGATTATFFIRGVGLSDFSANSAGAVAIYQDGVALNAPALQLGQLFDIQNVEVLRGPQGGGAGRNASAGAIKITSRKPIGDYQAQLRSSFSTFASDDARSPLQQEYEGAIEVPIIEEQLSTRLAFRFRDRAPWLENGCGDLPPIADRPVAPRPTRIAEASLCGERQINRSTGNRSAVPAGLPSVVGNQHNWAARGQLRYQPSNTDMDWLLNLHGSKLNQDSTLGQAIGTGIAGDEFGGRVDSGYVEPDILAERCRIQGSTPVVASNSCLNDGNAAIRQAGFDKIASNLATNRPLDENPYRGDYNRVGQTSLDTWGANISGEMQLAGINIKSVTSFDGYFRSRDTDTDFTSDVLFEFIQTDQAWQIGQDLGISGELENYPFRWEVGGYYLQERLRSEIETRIAPVPPPPTIPFGLNFRSYRQLLWSFGIYGGFSWDLSDSITLEGGVRYNWERKKFSIADRTIGSPRVPTIDGDVKTWHAPTGTLAVRYRHNDAWSAYLKYSRGFKAGHFNSANAFNPIDVRPAEPVAPEFVDAWEIGLRGRWWEGRFALGTAFFYYIYQDQQVFLVESTPQGGPTLQIISANTAQTYGLELDFQFEPLQGLVSELWEGLVITGRFGWLETEYLDFTNSVVRNLGPPIGNAEIINDFSGNQLINSPKFSASGSVSWAFNFGRWGTIIPRYDFSWTDTVPFDPTEGRGELNFEERVVKPENAIGQQAYWLHNLRLSYRLPTGTSEISFWVRNVADQRYKNYSFDASFFRKITIHFPGEPRAIGLDFSATF